MRPQFATVLVWWITAQQVSCLSTSAVTLQTKASSHAMPKRRSTNLGKLGQKKPTSPALGAAQPVDGGAAEPDDDAVEEPADDAVEDPAVSSSDDESGAGSDLSDDNDDSAEDYEESECEEEAAVISAGSRLTRAFQAGVCTPVSNA